MSRKRKQNFGRIRSTDRCPSHDPMTYYILVVQLRGGQTETRRFRASADFRAIPSEVEKVGFVRWALSSFGIRPDDLADLGTDPTTAILAFDTEGECKVEYDRLVASAGLVPGRAIVANVTAPGGRS